MNNFFIYPFTTENWSELIKEPIDQFSIDIVYQLLKDRQTHESSFNKKLCSLNLEGHNLVVGQVEETRFLESLLEQDEDKKKL